MNKKVAALVPFLVIPGAILASMAVAGLFGAIAWLTPDVSAFGLSGLAVGCATVIIGSLAIAFRDEVQNFLCPLVRRLCWRESCPFQLCGQ